MSHVQTQSKGTGKTQLASETWRELGREVLWLRRKIRETAEELGGCENEMKSADTNMDEAYCDLLTLATQAEVEEVAGA